MIKPDFSNPFLFACGVPRSGTTLLQRMLNSHPDLAVANDSHFIPRALETSGKHLVADAISGNTIPLTNELTTNVFEYHRFYRLGVTPKQFQDIASKSENYKQLVSGIYDQVAQNQGKSLGGEKTPDYIRRLDLLHVLFPNARLIHIVRDGRNVALSLLQWATPTKGPGRIDLWNISPIAVCALWWKWFLDVGAQQSSSIASDHYVTVHYESLIHDPQETLESLCCFLGIEFDTSMLQFNKNKVQTNPALSAKSAWLPPTKGLRDWRNEMTNDDIALFQEIAGDCLVSNGYELRSIKTPPCVKELAYQSKLWWNENFLSKNIEPDSQPQPAF